MINAQSELLQSYINKTRINNGNASMPAPYTAQKTEVDTFEKSNPKKPASKKQKIAKWALLGATAGAIIWGVFAGIRYKGKIIKSGENLLNKAKKGTEQLSKYENGANNITNIKDSLTRKILYKIPGYEKFDRFTSNLYKKSISKSIFKSHTKAQKALLESDKGILEALEKSNLAKDKKETLLSLIQKRQAAVKEFASKDAISKRFSTVDKSLDRLDVDAIKRIKDITKDGIKGAKVLTTESVVKSRLGDAKKLQSSLLENFQNLGLNEEEAKEFSTLLKSLGNEEVLKKSANAQKLFEKSFSKESSDLFNKLRDINCGSAPTDIMGMATTAGLLGLYTAQADTKEERVGVTLTTGLPLLTTFGTTIVATTKMVSGFKALGLGALTGFIAKTIGGVINKAYQKKHNTENAPKTIVTYDDYTKKAKDMKKKIIK